jgi:hypothetical protein
MAKADDTISTSWPWLRDALALAKAAFGSEALAKARLTEWLAAGKLPWRCMSWSGLDAEGIAKLRQELRADGIMLLAPSAAYCEGDSQFWEAASLLIDWEDSTACESGLVTDGAQALGIEVSQAHLRTLLPKRSLNEDAQTMPAEQEVLEPKAWLAWARKEYPQQRNERPSSYIRRLHGLMQKAGNVTEAWKSERTLRVRYYEAVKAEETVQKERKLPRTV